MAVEIKILDTSEIRKLRHLVLWPHLNSFEDCTIAPDLEATTFHMGAIEESEVVGTSTFLIDINDDFEEKNQYRLRAMATSPKTRGTGLGAEIIDKGVEELENRGVKLLWCDARIVASGFYEKIGFKAKGEVYDVPNIGPHKLMYKELKDYNK